MSHPTQKITVIVAAIAMLMLTGCEDLEARKTGADAARALTDVKLELEKVQVENKKLEASLAAVKSTLESQIGSKLADIETRIMNDTKGAIEKVFKDAELTRTQATGVVTGARADFDKQLDSVKTALTGDIAKVREELKAQTDDLRKFMDNQLKDVYPYAFKPKRNEGDPPAGAEQK